MMETIVMNAEDSKTNRPQKFVLKGGLSCFSHFLAAESPLKIMKYAFYFMSKALFVLKIFKFLS